MDKQYHIAEIDLEQTILSLKHVIEAHAKTMLGFPCPVDEQTLYHIGNPLREEDPTSLACP